jgi:hypothetical protein
MYVIGGAIGGACTVAMITQPGVGFGGGLLLAAVVVFISAIMEYKK